jgi:hypothetical protein
MQRAKSWVALAALACAAACSGDPGEAPAHGLTPTAELMRGYVPARSVPPLAVRSQAHTPEPVEALDPALLTPDQPENVVVVDHAEEH